MAIPVRSSPFLPLDLSPTTLPSSTTLARAHSPHTRDMNSTDNSSRSPATGPLLLLLPALAARHYTVSYLASPSSLCVKPFVFCMDVTLIPNTRMNKSSTDVLTSNRKTRKFYATGRPARSRCAPGVAGRSENDRAKRGYP